jgi:hypothetical protein
VVAGCCLLALGLVLLWMVRSLVAERAPDAQGTDLETLRSQTLGRIGALERSHVDGELDVRGLCQRLGAEVRRFAGIATAGDADYVALPQLRRHAVKDPRLEPVVELVELLTPGAFAARADVHPTRVLTRAREVVEQWR